MRFFYFFHLYLLYTFALRYAFAFALAYAFAFPLTFALLYAFVFACYFGPRLYPLVSLVITLVVPVSVRVFRLSLNISDTAH